MSKRGILPPPTPLPLRSLLKYVEHSLRECGFRVNFDGFRLATVPTAPKTALAERVLYIFQQSPCTQGERDGVRGFSIPRLGKVFLAWDTAKPPPHPRPLSP